MASRGSNNPEPLVEKVHVRGIEYTIRELGLDEYTEINKKATVKRRIEDDDGQGTTVEGIDQDLQMRLIVTATVSPKVDFKSMGLRAYGVITRNVNRVNFDYDEEIKNSQNGTGAEEKGEGDKPGNE